MISRIRGWLIARSPHKEDTWYWPSFWATVFLWSFLINALKVEEVEAESFLGTDLVSKSFELLYYCQRKIYVLVFGRLLLKRIIHFNSSLAVLEGITQIFSKLHGAEHNFSNAIHLSSSSICLNFRYVSLLNVQNLFYFSKSSFAYFARWL